MKQHFERALGLVIMAAWAAVGLLSGVPSGAQDGDRQHDAERRCRPELETIGCGGVHIIHMREEIHSWLHLLKMQEHLRTNPEASESVWWKMWSMMAAVADHDEALIRRQSAALHWELRDDGFFDPEVLDRSFWMSEWLAAYPRSEFAWRRWLELEKELYGVENTLATLYLALEQEPDNEAILTVLRSALVDQKDEAALLELSRHAFAADPTAGAEVWDGFDPEILPEPTRSLWLSYRYRDYEAQYRVLKDFVEGLPEGTPIDHGLRLYFLQLADIEDDEEVDGVQSLESMLNEGPAILHHHRICYLFDSFHEDEAFEACTRDVLARAEAAGMHLRGAEFPGNDLRDIHHWDNLRTELQDELRRQALAANDWSALEGLLVDGPDQGYAHRWSLSLAEMDRSLLLAQAMEGFHRGIEPPDEGPLEWVDFDDPEVQAEAAAIDVEAVEALKSLTCERLEELEVAGELRGYVQDAATSCPGRVGAMAEAFRSCRRTEAVERLEASMVDRLQQLSPDALMKLDLPWPVKLAELDRRRTEPMDLEALRRLHRLTIDLRLEFDEMDGLGAQLDDWAVADAMDLWTWIGDRSYSSGRLLGLAAAALTKVWPADADLHLLVAFEALFPEAEHSPDLPMAQVRLKLVLGLDLTVRQRAEAHYMLGRLLVLEKRFEEATFHLSRFFDPFLIHGGCTASHPACDRDYMLHMSAVGDRARLESYWQRRQEAVERSQGQSEAERSALGEIAAARIFTEDPLVKDLFMESGCGSVFGVARLRALLAGPETDEAVREAWRHRLEVEAALPCVRSKTPSPWQADEEDPNGRVAAAALLIAGEPWSSAI